MARDGSRSPCETKIAWTIRPPAVQEITVDTERDKRVRYRTGPPQGPKAIAELTGILEIHLFRGNRSLSLYREEQNETFARAVEARGEFVQNKQKMMQVGSKQRVSACLKASAFLVTALCLVSLHAQDTKQITIDGDSRGATFDGLGAVSAGASSRLLIDYPEPQRGQILDYLFKPGYGAALQHLKVEVGADVNSTDGAEPSHMRSRKDHNYTRGYEWWLMREARRRNPSIVLDTLPWGAPGWVGGGHLYSKDMAGYMADFIAGAEAQHLHIAYTGVWNEKVYDATYVRELYKALAARHLNTKIVCCDEYIGEGKGQWAIADAIKSDSKLASAVKVIGVHYPLEEGKITTTRAARESGRPLWSSEDQPNSGSGPFVSRNWPAGGRILAHLYNKNYLDGGLTATEIWSPITSYYDILAAPNSGLMYANTPWSGHYRVQGAIWSTAHTTQFTKPGWQYLDLSSGLLPQAGSYVALRSPDKSQWSVVLETIGATAEMPVQFDVKGGLLEKTIHIWETNDKKTFEHVSDANIRDHRFSYTFEPNSLYTLTTTTGQGRGKAEPPPASAFPAEYSEHFEKTELGRSPRFLADQDGAFEVHPCPGRAGKCLQQVITRKPIPWGPLPDPFTLTGDASAKDYRVESDFRVHNGSATVMGRIDSADVFQDGSARLPSGYELTIAANGDWTLVSSVYKKPTVTLAKGHAALPPDSWHHFALWMKGDDIVARLDGERLAEVHDISHTHGFFALGSTWDVVQFDNLKVGPSQ